MAELGATLRASVDGPAVEQEISRDLVRRAVIVSPVLVVASAIGWGVDGALSALFGVALVSVNFLAAAALMTIGARISPNALFAAVMLGFLARFGLLTLAVFGVKDTGWVALGPLFATILVTHVGLLVWETRHVSATLAYPGLKPKEDPSP